MSGTRNSFLRKTAASRNDRNLALGAGRIEQRKWCVNTKNTPGVVDGSIWEETTRIRADLKALFSWEVFASLVAPS